MTHERPFEILLVEDNPGDVLLTREALSEWPFSSRLNVARDGVEAIQYLRDEGSSSKKIRPDLILLDLNLPRMDGREVLMEIKQDNLLKTIPVVILSTSDADMDVIKTYGLGANCYVIKPLGIDNFIRTIHSIVNYWLHVAKLPSRELISQYRTLMKSNSLQETKLQSLARDTLKILVVDDNYADADFIREMLAEQSHPSFVIHSCERLSTAIEILENESFDAILLDLGLPDSQGLETYLTLAAHFPFIPVVINTVLDRNEVALKAIREGAQDFVIKGESDGRLLSRVLLYAIERKHIDEDRKHLIAREQMAHAESEKAIQLRDEFLSIASHELKTPMTPLALQIEVLKRTLRKEMQQSDTPFVERVLKDLQISERQVKRMTELIDNLLDISKISAGRLKMNFESTSLTDLVKGVIEKFQPQIELNQSPVSMELCEDVIGNWDRFRIEQVVINLLTNAMKYSSGKPIRISLDSKDNLAILNVQDFGVGIASEDFEKIFQRFERVSNGTYRSGLGLGLYIVRQIIDSHQGSIRVQSEKGKGSIFTVELPKNVEGAQSTGTT